MQSTLIAHRERTGAETMDGISVAASVWSWGWWVAFAVCMFNNMLWTGLACLAVSCVGAELSLRAARRVRAIEAAMGRTPGFTVRYKASP